MVSHKFSNGQTVQARKNPWAALAGAYEIVCRLPASGGDKQYWVKSLENGDHRVVRESDLVVEFPGEGAPLALSPIDSRYGCRATCQNKNIPDSDFYFAIRCKIRISPHMILPRTDYFFPAQCNLTAAAE
jgi:hypothetical protein